MSKLTDKIDEARTASRRHLDNMKDGTGERIESVREITSEKLDSAKEIANDKSLIVREHMSASKQRAAELLSDGTERSIAVTKETARKAVTKSEETVARSPLTVVAGGLALGALFAALLPRTKTETQIVGAAGRAVNDAAKKVIETAKEVGQEQAAELGLTPDTFRDQVKDWLGKLFEAAKSAAKEDRRDK